MKASSFCRPREGRPGYRHAFAGLMALSVACAGATFERSRSSADLDGVWSARRVVSLERRLTVQRHAGAWQVVSGELRAPLALTKDGGWRASFGVQGELRLARGATSSVADWRGHWVQPAGHFSPGPYAVPVRLGAETRERWTATVTPPAARVEVYLRIDGNTAFVREPDRNLGRRLGRLTVVRNGTTVRFIDRRQQERLRAEWVPERDVLVAGGVFGDRLILRRVSAHAVSGYFARPSGVPYRYRAPDHLSDGWAVGTLADVDMSVEGVESLVAEIARPPRGWRSPYVYGIAVARHGRLVLEEYFFGHHRARLHDIASATMSFGSTLVGIATDDRALTLRTPALPSGAQTAGPTLEHLLSMRSGFDCDDNEDATAGNIYLIDRSAHGGDWHALARGLPFASKPGTVARYCTVGYNLSGALLKSSIGGDIPAYFAARLAEPLDIRHYQFRLMPNGVGYLGSGLRLRLRDFAKLGQLYLSGGRWRGRRVVSADWVRRATSAHSTINRQDDYGYGWWRTTYILSGRRYEAYYASGTGGQLVIVLPGLDMVIATQGKYGDYRSWARFHDVVVPHFFIGAVR